MSTTPNMGLNLPVPTVTPGPAYASQNNTAFDVIDQHNHTAGQGVPVPSSGLNINGTLSFQQNNATELRSTQYFDNSTPLGLPADLRCVYSVNGDLYYNDGVGNQIQLTVGGALNAASVGGIGGDYATSTASVFYTSLNTTFTFWQSSGVPATIDVGTVIIRAEVASAFGVSLTANPAMSADYTLVLPTVLPASLKILTLDASGNIGATLYIDGTTIKNNANVLSVDAASLNIQSEHAWELNGSYSALSYPLTAIDSTFFAPYNLTITSVWIYNGTAGSSGSTTYDLKVASPGGAYSSILSTLGAIASTAASNIWTDSGSVVAAQTGVTKPVLSTTSITAGRAIRFDMTTSMGGSPTDARIRIFYQKA